MNNGWPSLLCDVKFLNSGHFDQKENDKKKCICIFVQLKFRWVSVNLACFFVKSQLIKDLETTMVLTVIDVHVYINYKGALDQK